MRNLTIFACLLLLGTFSIGRALSYVESSSGLEPPAMDGGRTELEFADLNGDGNVDIISIGDHGNPYINTEEHGIMVWFGDGRGNWSVFQNGDFGYGGIAVGDINNDGKWDVAYGMHHNYDTTDLGDSMVEVALGDGTGRNWTAWDAGIGLPGETYGMFSTDFADIDNDGWLDFAANTFGSGDGFRVYHNNHDSAWTQCFNAPHGNSNMDISFGDCNGDGNPDIAACNQYGTVWFGDGAGGFTLADHNLPPASDLGRNSIALGDIDADGAKELAFINDSGGIDVWDWRAGGDSWASMCGSLPTTGTYEMVQLYDMNADGVDDVVAFGNHVGTVWSGDGAGNWTEAAGFTTPTDGNCEALRCGGDIDHNGYPDLVLVDNEGTWPSDRNHLRCFREASTAESLRITPCCPRGGERYVSGSVQFIDWVCAVPPGETARVRLEYSDSGSGGPWTLIADTLANGDRFQTAFSEAVGSSNCYIRYTATTRTHSASSITARPFTVVNATAAREMKPDQTWPDARPLITPNPAHGLAKVSYTLPAKARVRVSLCDVTGREVRLLHSGAELPGAHALNFSTTHLPSGLYFCRVHTEASDRLTKLVVP